MASLNALILSHYGNALALPQYGNALSPALRLNALISPISREAQAVWAKTTGSIWNIWHQEGDLWLYRDDHGKTSAHGWDIDHIIPKALGGSDDLSNLRARHYSTNRSAGGLLGQVLRDN